MSDVQARVFAQVIQVLERHDLRYTIREPNAKVSLGFGLSDVRWGEGYSVLILTDNNSLRVFYSCDYRVPENMRRRVALAIAAINWDLNEGAVEIDLRDGEVRMRFAVPVGEGDAMTGTIDAMLLNNQAFYTPVMDAVFDLVDKHGGNPEGLSEERCVAVGKAAVERGKARV